MIQPLWKTVWIFLKKIGMKPAYDPEDIQKRWQEYTEELYKKDVHDPDNHNGVCPTLCDPIDSSPPGSPVPGILQARTLEWVAISFYSAGKLERMWRKGNALTMLVGM